MCGIVGFSGNFHFKDLDKAVDLISHRGPDYKGTFKDSSLNIGLGHTRLSIIDLSSNGHQPMISTDKNVIVIFNGEIYNFQELRIQLISEGYKFTSDSDTEVILYLYHSKGIEFLKSLNGIFAIAIYDFRNNNLIIIRDGLGVKPLYYFVDKDSIVFSSEIKALTPFIGNKFDLSHTGVEKYLTYLWCPGDETMFKFIKKVQPGEYLTIKNGKIINKNQWFKLPQSIPIKKNKDRAESINHLTNSLKNAVKRQLVADVPVGAFLSGGLDSSAIVALAKKYQNIECFTIEPLGGADDDTTNDLPYAKEVASHLKVNLNIVKINPNKLKDDLEQMIWQLDEPLADPAALNVLYISRKAKEMGIKVLLSGLGGDDILTGYRRHLALKYNSLFTWMPIYLRNQLENITDKFDKRNASGRRFSKLFENASLDGNERLISYFKWIKFNNLKNIYTGELKKSSDNTNIDKPFIEFLSQIDNSISPLNKMLLLEQRFFLGDHNLTYTDKMSMAEGVEVRVPFLDNEVLEAAANIPSNLKIRGITGKWILKKSMEPYLPKKIIYRKKSGFGAPLRRWMRYDLRDMVSEYLSKESLINRGLFDHKAVTKMINDNDKGIQDASYTLFSLICIEIWCRKFTKH